MLLQMVLVLASNYSTLASDNLTGLSITAKPITIAAPTIASRAYDATTAAGVITLGAITGLVGVETLTVTPTGTAYSKCQCWMLILLMFLMLIADGTGLATNYSALATSLAVPGSITAKPITISAPTIAPKVYDATTAAGVITQGTVAGLVGGANTYCNIICNCL